jgi:hypothetical protein
MKEFAKFSAFLAFLSMAAAAWAQTALAPPQVGFIQDGHGQIHPVNGVAGNFLLGGPAATKVLSAAFSGSFGLLKSSSALLVTDSRGHAIAGVDAPPGLALFAFSADGSPALAYFPQTASFRVWDGHTFQASGDSSSLAKQAVLSIAALNSAAATIIVQRPDGLFQLGVQLSTGAVVSQMSLPGVSAPALLVANGALVYRDAQGVVVRRPNGAENHIAAHLPASVAFSQMGQAWLQVTDLGTGRLYAVSIQPGSEHYYTLPEVRQ